MSNPVEIHEAMKPGMLKALNRQRNRTACKACGYPIPVYPGRYPNKCPHCGEPLKGE